MRIVGGRANAALIAAPAAGGLVGAHALAYRLAGGGPGADVDHGYLGQAPFVLAVLSAVALAGLGVRIVRGRRSRRLPAWPFATLPPVAFAVQEHLERLLPSGRWPSHLVTERVFLVGLALQLPFALGAYLLARCLAAVAEAVGGVLARRRPRLRRNGRARRRAPFSAPAAAGLAGAVSSRGPPAACVA